MAKFIGRQADIGVAIETTRGTAESSATYWLPKTELTVDDRIEQVVDESSYGVIEDSTDASTTKYFAEGEVTGVIGVDNVGVLLYGALGSVSTTGPTDSAYTHTFTVSQSAQHPSMTIFQDDPNQDYTYALGMVSSLALDLQIGQYAQATLGFRSKKGSTATLSPSYSAESKFLPQHATVKIASAQSGLDGASATNVRNVQLTVTKNVEDDDALGTDEPVDILNKQFTIEGSVELVFDDETFKDELQGDTAKAMRIALTNDDVTIGASTNPSITIDLYRIKVNEFTRNYGNDDIVTATVNFKAFYSVSDSKMLDVTLVNDVTSY